jgi:hypothetical protein
MPGTGFEPVRPTTGAADFKSAAYRQFRHPGGARVTLYSPVQLYVDGIFAGGFPMTIAISSCGSSSSA